MQNLLRKIGLSEKMARNFWGIMIIAFAGAIIYGLPYFRYDYYDAYLQVYNLTDSQMGVFGSILGIFGMISYLFGGVVCDRFSTRTILTVSLIGTGLGGFVHLLPLNYTALLCLYAFWGCSSLFAFWPCCVKAVRILTGSDDQGKAFGFFEGGRGVGAAVMATGAVLAFKLGSGAMEDQVAGMKAAIIFYSLLTILMGVLTWFTVKEDSKEKSDKISFKGIGELLKMPAVWVIGLATFFNYVMTLSIYYFTPYLTEILGASVVFGAALAAGKRWLSYVGSIGGGYITDKIGAGRVILVSFLVMAVGTIAMLALPQNSSSVLAFVILFFVVYTFYNVNYSQTWAMMDEGAIPERLCGTAAGLISTVGYLPEIFISLVAGYTLEAMPGYEGYKTYFTFVIVMMLAGAVVSFIWMKMIKNRKAEAKAEAEE